MSTYFNYDGTAQFNEEIEVEDIGNCCVRASNGEWCTFYLIIKTIRGQSYCLEYGPVVPDLPLLPKNFYVNYSIIKFNEKTLYKKIFGFLNDPKKQIVDAEVEEDSFNAEEDFHNIFELFNKIS